jgi:uncharacterized protein (TIRG00374 family)
MGHRGRIIMLALGAVSLYFLAPKLISLFTSWPDLKTLDPLWFGLALVFEAASYLALWSLQRVGAVGGIVPGGAATAGAFGYRMLVKAGIGSVDVASGLTAATIATTATVLAMPLLTLPAIVGGTAAPHGLVQAAYVGVAGFVGVAILAATAFAWDRPLMLVGRAVRWLIRHVLRRDTALDLPERLIGQRDRMKETFGRRWYIALTGAVGKVGFDYLALVCCLAAVGARPSPSLVLLAYVAGALLAMIPFTPGGLGFVEAGLAGMLALAGVGGQQALVSTLAYRLVSFWLPLPIGGIAYLMYRHRFGSASGDSPAASPSS